MDRKIVRGTLMIFALVLYIAAIFLPWLSERYRLLWILPPPPAPKEALFWSFQALVSYDGHYRFTDCLLFSNYWFKRSGFYLGWLGVFVFQSLTVISAFIALFKEKIKGKTLHAIAAAIISAMSLILCIRQRSIQAGMWLVGVVEFSVGFWLATASTTLFFASYLIEKRKVKS